jgi:inhibitor of KinA
MSNSPLPYQAYPLGDAALTLEWGPAVDEAHHREVMSRWKALKKISLPGPVEWAPAYSSLTLYYDPVEIRKQAAPGQTAFDWLLEQLGPLLDHPAPPIAGDDRLVRIPVCYADEFALDLPFLAAEKKCPPDALIQWHTSREYRVYMLGFLPGFAYMGELPEELVTTRKKEPVPVSAGSVGLAGRQTGIYPFDSPGGWTIIGKTPWSLFDPRQEEPCLLRPGDRVQFYPISKEEYHNYYAYL